MKLVDCLRELNKSGDDLVVIKISARDAFAVGALLRNIPVEPKRPDIELAKTRLISAIVNSLRGYAPALAGAMSGKTMV